MAKRVAVQTLLASFLIVSTYGADLEDYTNEFAELDDGLEQQEEEDGEEYEQEEDEEYGGEEDEFDDGQDLEQEELEEDEEYGEEGLEQDELEDLEALAELEEEDDGEEFGAKAMAVASEFVAKVDADKDGKISRDEFLQPIDGDAPSEEDIAEVDKLMKLADIDKDGLLSIEEIPAIAAAFEGEEADSLLHIDAKDEIADASEKDLDSAASLLQPKHKPDTKTPDHGPKLRAKNKPWGKGKDKGKAKHLYPIKPDDQTEHVYYR